VKWASATRKGQRDDVLANHLPDVLIYDVLAPMKYEGAPAYRQSWDEWLPIRKVKDNSSCKIYLSPSAGMWRLHTASSSAAHPS
jgi:ketosteroid isomerase-like protein